jgi:hypothetical protein
MNYYNKEKYNDLLKIWKMHLSFVVSDSQLPAIVHN